MKKFISTTLALAFVGASALALVGCKDEETTVDTSVTKTQFLQTAAKGIESFLKTHTIGDDENATVAENYNDTNYGEVKASSTYEANASYKQDYTYMDGETQNTVELQNSHAATASIELSVKKVGDYYYIRNTQTSNVTSNVDEFDDEDKKVYTQNITGSASIQYDLGAHVNGETVTYYYAESETRTETTTSNDPNFTAEEGNGEAQTTKTYKALTADEYYGYVLEILEYINKDLCGSLEDLASPDSGETESYNEQSYKKDGDNLKVTATMFEMDVDYTSGDVSTMSGTGEMVINENGFVSQSANFVVNHESISQTVKYDTTFATVANLTPLASLDGYTLDEELELDTEEFSYSHGFGS